MPQVDKNLERTVGVLTKLDLMDKGTDARDVLEGRSLCLEHGWCAVVNRSQADINTRVDMSAARDNERDFFRGKPEYAHVNTGTDTLTAMLTQVLGNSIRRQVPLIQEVIDSSSNRLETELSQLGRSMPDDRGALMHEVLLSCGAFEKEFEAALDSGKGGGETIRVIFEEKLVGSLRALNMRDFYSVKNVKAVIDAADGYQPHLVAPEMGIRRLIELGLDKLHEPTVQCVRAVDRVLQSMVERAVDRHAPAGARGMNIFSASSRDPGRLAGGDASSTSSAKKRFASLAGWGGGGGGGGGEGGRRGSALGDAGPGSGGELMGEALRRFPALRATVTAAAFAALERHKKEAEGMVSAMVDMEASYFDADFFRRFAARRSLEDANFDPSSSASTGGDGGDGGGDRGSSAAGADSASADGGLGFDVEDGPDSHLRMIAASVFAYVDAVRARMAKTVPKAVVHCQVGFSSCSVQ